MANYPTIDALIAQFEGYGATQPNGQPTLATVNNNPGNLVYNDYTASLGATPGQGGFASFSTPTAGAAAEDALVTNYANNGATLDSLIASWAPSNAPGNSPQSTANYQNFLSQQLGAPGTTPLTSIEQPGQAIPTASNSSFLQSLQNLFMNPANTLGNYLAGTVTGSSSAGSWFTDPLRIGFFILGLLCIIGGIYLFKPVQQGVTVVSRGARRAGELLAA